MMTETKNPMDDLIPTLMKQRPPAVSLVQRLEKLRATLTTKIKLYDNIQAMMLIDEIEELITKWEADVRDLR